MGRHISIDLNPKLEIDIDAAPVAQALGLDVREFLKLLELRKIDQLCERGTDADDGLYRASFYYSGKRARLVVDRQGNPVGTVEAREQSR